MTSASHATIDQPAAQQQISLRVVIQTCNKDVMIKLFAQCTNTNISSCHVDRTATRHTQNLQNVLLTLNVSHDSHMQPDHR